MSTSTFAQSRITRSGASLPKHHLAAADGLHLQPSIGEQVDPRLAANGRSSLERLCSCRLFVASIRGVAPSHFTGPLPLRPGAFSKLSQRVRCLTATTLQHHLNDLRMNCDQTRPSLGFQILWTSCQHDGHKKTITHRGHASAVQLRRSECAIQVSGIHGFSRVERRLLVGSIYSCNSLFSPRCSLAMSASQSCQHELHAGGK